MNGNVICLANYNGTFFAGGYFDTAGGKYASNIAQWNDTAKCIITGIYEVTSNSTQIKVYPNPSDGVFILEQSAEKQKEEIEVYNVLGQKIFQHSFSALRTTLDLSGQPAGIYFYRVVSKKAKR